MLLNVVSNENGWEKFIDPLNPDADVLVAFVDEIIKQTYTTAAQWLLNQVSAVWDIESHKLQTLVEVAAKYPFAGDDIYFEGEQHWVLEKLNVEQFANIASNFGDYLFDYIDNHSQTIRLIDVVSMLSAANMTNSARSKLLDWYVQSAASYQSLNWIPTPLLDDLVKTVFGDGDMWDEGLSKFASKLIREARGTSYKEITIANLVAFSDNEDLAWEFFIEIFDVEQPRDDSENFLLQILTCRQWSHTKLVTFLRYLDTRNNWEKLFIDAIKANDRKLFLETWAQYVARTFNNPYISQILADEAFKLLADDIVDVITTNDKTHRYILTALYANIDIGKWLNQRPKLSYTHINYLAAWVERNLPVRLANIKYQQLQPYLQTDVKFDTLALFCLGKTGQADEIVEKINVVTIIKNVHRLSNFELVTNKLNVKTAEMLHDIVEQFGPKGFIVANQLLSNFPHPINQLTRVVAHVLK